MNKEFIIIVIITIIVIIIKEAEAVAWIRPLKKLCKVHKKTPMLGSLF